MITIQQFCTFHHCETVVIEEFLDHGIIEVHADRDVLIIPENQLSRVERALRLRNELGVNAAGIDIILTLLDRLDKRTRAIEDV